MDSSALTRACSSLLDRSTELDGFLISFVREARDAHDARQDLDSFNRELSSLSLDVRILREEQFVFPLHIQSSLVSVLGGCEDIISSIRALIERHRLRGLGRTGNWAQTGHDQVVALQSLLEARRPSLGLAIDFATILSTGAPNEDDRAAGLPVQRTEERLETVAEPECLRTEFQQLNLGDKSLLLDRFLDAISSAQSVCEDTDKGCRRHATVHTETLSEYMPETDRLLSNAQQVQVATSTAHQTLSATADGIYEQITQAVAGSASNSMANQVASSLPGEVQPFHPVTSTTSSTSSTSSTASTASTASMPPPSQALVLHPTQRSAARPAAPSVVTNLPSRLLTKGSLVENHILSVLRGAGCSIDDQDKLLPVYLLESCGSKQDESRAVEWLLQNGADVNACSTVDMRPRKCNHPRILGSALHLAVIHSGFESIVPVLLRYRADLETFASWLKDDGTAVSRGTALNLATWRGDLDSAAAIVDAGADTTSYGKSFLQRCARNSVAYALISGTPEYPVTRYAQKHNIQFRRGPAVHVSPSNVPAWRKFLTDTNWSCNAEQMNAELYEMYYRSLLQIYGLRAEKDGEWRVFSCTTLHATAHTDDERSHNHERISHVSPPPPPPSSSQTAPE